MAATTERSAVLSEAFSRGLSNLRSSRSTSGETSSSFEQLGQTLNRLDQITKSVANTTGLSQAQVARIALGASAHLGISTPVAGVQGNVSADKSYLSNLSAEERRVIGSMTNDQIAEFKQFGDRVSRDKSFATLIASDARDSQEIATRLAATTSRSERADAGLAERTAFAERIATAYERGEVLSIDIAQDPYNLQMFTRYAEQYGGTSEAAHVMMEAELARQAPKPNRVFSDATGVPNSFDELRARYSRSVVDPALGSDVSAQHRQNRGIVARFGVGAQDLPDVPPQASEVRSTVQEQGKDLLSEAAAEREAFDRNAQVTRAPDGTLSSERSLMKRTGSRSRKTPPA